MSKDDELVLVVPSQKIFEKGEWFGLQTKNIDYYIDLIKNNCQFKRRGDVETDTSFQQIIPYIVFSADEKYFVYRYLPKAGEQRLVDTYQLGVGGHINPIDNSNGNILEDGMMREWNEEVDFKGKILERKLVGILNDKTTPVEAVHLGLVYNFVGDSQQITIKETDKMAGELVDLKDIKNFVASNPKSIWMQIVYKDYLSKLS